MQNAVKTYADELKWLANNQDTDDWKTLYANVEQRFNEMTVLYILIEKYTSISIQKYTNLFN